jgi:hypothetical protein
VLYIDLDVMFIRPTRIFGEFDHFLMFNYTDPRMATCDHYGLKFDHYFNCGVRYYPQKMDQKIWKLGFDMIKNWNPERWDSEQIIYNHMMWSQVIRVQQAHQPHLAYQFLNANQTFNDSWNGVSLVDQAQVVHVHGSRGSSGRAELMEKLDEHFNDHL